WVRWFAISRNTFHEASAQVAIPWASKELKLDWNLKKRYSPGQKVRSQLKVRKGAAAVKGSDTEALVRITDRSLDYYVSDRSHWTEKLYSEGPPPAAVHHSALPAATQTVQRGDWKLEEAAPRPTPKPKVPSFRL